MKKRLTEYQTIPTVFSLKTPLSQADGYNSIKHKDFFFLIMFPIDENNIPFC